MKVFIDNKQVEIKNQADVRFSLNLAQKIELEGVDAKEYLRFEMPFSAENIAVMADAEQPLSTTMFNQKNHSARIEQDGATVLWGRAFLVESRVEDGAGGCYVVAIRPFAKVWEAEAARTLIHESQIDYNVTIGGGEIASSWTGDKMVRYLPVKNNSELVTVGGAVVVEMMTSADYFPFINVANFFKHVAQVNGYTIDSRFVESDYFKSLHFSGRYVTNNCEVVKERMDFLAGRVSSVETTASSQGIVYTNPLLESNTVGSLVEAVEPIVQNREILLPELFNNGKCFSINSTGPAYVPASTVSMAFEYQLSYTTDYYIQDRNTFKCMDTITLHDGVEVNLEVGNMFEDMRDGDLLDESFNYNLMVFDFDYAASYKLTGDKSTGGSDAQIVESTERCKLFYTGSTCTYSNLKLWIKRGGDYEPFDGDWAVYKGANQQRGRLSINLSLRSVPREYEAGIPVYFSNVKFSGAEAGANFELHDNVRIRPLFLQQPSVGSSVSWSDISAHELYQMDVIKAVAQMFDLKFFTDDFNKKIYIEPYSSVVDNQNIIDLSYARDESKTTRVKEMGEDMPRRVELEYSDGDGYVSRWNVYNAQTMGYWTGEIKNVFARDSLQWEKNVIFTPSLSRDNLIRYAPSAHVLQVGPRDKYGFYQAYDEDLNFPIKIVRYIGMKPLEVGETWGWPSYSNEYPFVGFHYEGEQDYEGDGDVNPDSLLSEGQQAYDNGFSLCFEDRDGVAGLHNFHKHRLDVYNKSKMITQYVFLEPEHLERLMLPTSQRMDWRALCRINVAGENILCRLVAIEDYDPQSRESTKCVFIKEV